jgi:hypothetical protein
VAGLFGAEAPAYVGPGQTPSGERGGAAFGIFPSTPKYETPAAAAAPAAEAMQLKLAIPGVLSAEVTITIPPSIVAKLPELVPELLAIVEAIRDISRTPPLASQQEKRAEERGARSEIEERVWERE